MSTSIELLRSHLTALRHASGAVSVSLFTPGRLGPSGPSVLLHEGGASPVPELASAETAEGFARQCEQALASRGGGADRDPLRLFASRASECRVFRLVDMLSPAVEGRGSEEVEPRRRRRSDVAREPWPNPTAVWMGLRLPDAQAWLPGEFEASAPHGTPVAPDAVGGPAWLGLLGLGSRLVAYVRQVSEILLDPVTGLPGRAELHSSVAQALDAARESGQPLALLMANPDDFTAVNERLGRAAGDRALQETAARFRKLHRRTDRVARYGGAIFASVLPGADVEGARVCAEKVRKSLTDTPFLDGTLQLDFSLGLAAWDPEDTSVEQPLDLIRRAEQALSAAKRAGGGGVTVWRSDWDTGGVDLSELSGIFTGEMTRDYRNLVLLSHTVTAIAGKHDFDGLAASVAERLHSTFKPDRMGLFSWSEGEGPRLIRGLEGRPQERRARHWIDTLDLGPEQTACLEGACQERRPRERRIATDRADGESRVSYTIPLIVGDACLGAVYLEGRAGVLSLDSADLVFLRALAAQLGVALDRARLSELEKRRQEQEERRLRAELDELREAIRQAKLVYRSEPMEALLASVRRVAPTDATVLITGESGTGKELIARTLHELSPRRQKPLVIVDCGAIPSTLIESELFGHEKGAYTGAQQRKLGRLAEANGGSLLLDEIGELPLEVQSKLLRFTQEKQLTPVGENRPRAVDVRLIAATNRNLMAEVQAGRFRADLFYRLNVFRLEVPPLRERPDDVLYLARHFLETYALLYHKDVRRLSAEVEATIVAHRWPGNVRELQNLLARAVILCEGEELGVAELGLPGSVEGAIPPVRVPPAPAPTPKSPPGIPTAPPSPVAPGASVSPGPGESEEEPPERLWETLRLAFARQVEVALARGARRPAPLGKWLAEDLLLEADAAVAGVASRAAARVGVPESTYRRRLAQAAGQAEAGLAARQESWPEVRAVLRAIVRRGEPTGESLLAKAERVLLERVLARVPGDVTAGSALLGVSAPTFRRREALLRPGG